MDPKKSPFAIMDITKKLPAWPFSTATTWRYAREGQLKTIRLGRRKWVTLELLEQFLAEHTEGRAA